MHVLYIMSCVKCGPFAKCRNKLGVVLGSERTHHHWNISSWLLIEWLSDRSEWSHVIKHLVTLVAFFIQNVDDFASVANVSTVGIYRLPMWFWIYWTLNTSDQIMTSVITEKSIVCSTACFVTNSDNVKALHHWLFVEVGEGVVEVMKPPVNNAESVSMPLHTKHQIIFVSDCQYFLLTHSLPILISSFIPRT